MMAKSTRDRYERTKDLIEDLRLIRSGQAPLFARSMLDLSQIPATGPAEPGPPATAAQPAGGPGLDSRLIIVGLVVMILSVLANLVLLLVVLGK